MAAMKKNQAPTVEQIQTDYITQLASHFWAPFSTLPRQPYNPTIIEEIYINELLGYGFHVRRVMLLEFSQYLENYLWPNYDSTEPSKCTVEHVLSIVVMVNEKFRERVPVWSAFQHNSSQFGPFFRQLMGLFRQNRRTKKEQTIILVFLVHCFNSLEVDLVREQVQRLVSLPIWENLLPGQREQLFQENPMYRKVFKALPKKDSKLSAVELSRAKDERTFLCNLIQQFYSVLENIVPNEGAINMDAVHYCERVLELLITLEAQLPTRRFFHAVTRCTLITVRSRLSRLYSRKEGKLFSQLLDMLAMYSEFEINEVTGEPFTDDEMVQKHYDRITALQKAAFRHFPELRSFSLANVSRVDTRETLTKHFTGLSNRKLHEVAAYLNLVAPPVDNKENTLSTELLLELLVSFHERRPSQLEQLNSMPLYPTEEIIWDENVVPTEYFSGEGCLALPKLNLQFLTLHDYLLTNFTLFRLESTYEIRQDIEDSVIRMKPWQAEDGSCFFGGWARMALPIQGFSVVEVAKPNIGESFPSRVRADIVINVSLRREVRKEWTSLRKHDVAFLLTVQPTKPIGTRYMYKEPFIPQVGLTYVRGCEIEGMLDENGRVIDDIGMEPVPVMRGDVVTYRVWLDPNQYQQDMTKTAGGHEDIYESFNVLMRRKPKENNFKAVLETIRDLMNTECVVPDWLHDILLGYGDPGVAHYSNMSTLSTKLDWNDTFLSLDHLKNSFPGQPVRVTSTTTPAPPFRVTLPLKKSGDRGVKRSMPSGQTVPEAVEEDVIIVEPHVIASRGPYPYNKPKSNQVPFTPTQIEAIKAGMQPGLTMVVGPPGTGKTDVAVQIISNIYHNFPDQRTLIVTHSNQALNQLFEKIIALDIDERHLLRLGHGEEALETEKDFSRYGRVNFVLAQRLELLEQVGRLQESLGVQGDVAYTCETAGYFYLYQVLSRWEEYLSKVKVKQVEKGDLDKVKMLFPFLKFFDNAPQPLFKGRTYAEDLEIADGCFRYIKKIFQQLEEYRAFELLRGGADRSWYLLVKEAKIIAMTCTHAALKRRDLVQLGFEYDNILMEESAQILEIETFIPLLLQNPRDGYNRLKRWIMIGDHHQLPPVIKNMAFQKYSNMEQSLFTRLVRLGVPTVELDAQGRARPSIASLYNWRYRSLGNLPHVDRWLEYQMATPGFVFDYQLIDVGDFQGVGESEPNPYFYQNLAEAEYVVATFMYMRLLGYPANKISVLTTYNGQKHLIRDVIQQRCGENPLIGRPHKVTTVDRFQGQQNDYILLSLVRTRAVGHLRDVRRLVVAMSRARLGLYIFARVSLFKNCFELTPAFNQLVSRPLQLHIAPEETYPPERKIHERPLGEVIVIHEMPQLAQFVFDLYQVKVQYLRTKHGYDRPPASLTQVSNYTTPKRHAPQTSATMEQHPGVDSEDEEQETSQKQQKETLGSEKQGGGDSTLGSEKQGKVTLGSEKQGGGDSTLGSEKQGEATRNSKKQGEATLGSEKQREATLTSEKQGEASSETLKQEEKDSAHSSEKQGQAPLGSEKQGEATLNSETLKSGEITPGTLNRGGDEAMVI